MAKKDLAHHVGHAFAAFRISLTGLKHAVTTETAFMQEALALFIIPLAGWLLGLPFASILLLLIGWLAVMAVELLNMGLEAVCDLVCKDYRPLIKVAKDAGSAAVFLLITANVIFWIYLIYTHW